MSKIIKLRFLSQRTIVSCLKGSFILFILGMSSCVPLPVCESLNSAYLKNQANDNAYIKFENNRLSIGEVNEPEKSGIWKFDCIDNIYFTIKKLGTGGKNSQYLHAQNGSLKSSMLSKIDHSAHWKKTKVAGTTYYRIENRLRQGKFLCVKNNSIVIDGAPTSDKQSHWEFVDPNEVEVKYPDWKEMTKTVMGKGYRGAGSYADMVQSTESLFDLDQLVQNTTPAHIPKYEGKRVEGRSIREYVNDISASIEINGSSGLFSGSARAGFSSSTIENSDNYFYSVLGVIQYYRLDLDYTNVPLRAQVKKDIAHMPVKELIEKYGTYFIKSAFIGGRVSFNTYIDHTKFSNKKAYDASVEAAYGTISGKVNIDGSNKNETETFYKQANILVFGGNPAEASKLRQDKDTTAYANWLSTLEDNMTLADFGLKGLVPISVLAETEERRVEIGSYIKDYLIKQGNQLPEEPVSIFKNSTVMIQAKDNRYVTRPIFSPWPNEFYYPKLKNETTNSDDNFRVAGLFTFNISSSDILKSNDNVSIIFDEQALFPDWQDGMRKKERNPDFLKRKYLKAYSFTVRNAHYYFDDSESSRWVIEKIGGVSGEPIYSGDEVYIYSPVNDGKEYLYPHPNSELFVEKFVTVPQNKDKFIWKIILDYDKNKKIVLN